MTFTSLKKNNNKIKTDLHNTLGEGRGAGVATAPAPHTKLVGWVLHLSVANTAPWLVVVCLFVFFSI